MNIQLEDTITAVATPSGIGGIGIVRISGSNAVEIIKKCITSDSGFENWNPKQLYRAKIYNEDGSLLDDILVVWMPKGNSYTGEEVVELHCHGNPFILEQVLQRLHQLGARLAERGEFTLRAFLNGKIDLTSAEGLNDLIRASSTKALALSHLQHGGRLSVIFNEIRDELIKVLAHLEAEIDFPHEPIEVLSCHEYINRLNPIRDRLNALVSTSKTGRLIKDGVRVVLIGDTNVGKSTLLNSLVDEDRVIVSKKPGTTRDSVEAECFYKGMKFIFIDTAGLRTTEDEVEKLGISQTRKQVVRGDVLLLVKDVTNIISNEYSEDPRTIVVYNKADLISDAKELLGKIAVSAKNRTGINELREIIFKKTDSSINQNMEEGILSTSRQQTLANNAKSLLDRAADALSKSSPAEIVAVDIQSALRNIDEIVGKNVNLDLLNEIFSQFCIGK